MMNVMNRLFSKTVRRRAGSDGRAVLLVLLVLAPAAQAADTLRCGSRLVSVGELAAKVEALCGRPAYKDVEGGAYARGYDAAEELWTYNFGPNRLLQQLRFRDGRLDSIHSGGYGFNADEPGHCGPSTIVAGLSKYELLHDCGEPISKRAETVLVPLVRDGPVYRRPDGVYAYQGGYQREVFREHWVYNFGANYFLRDVTLENGKVIDVEDGERGFNPR